MSKRKLTRQQQFRIDKVQLDRLSRSQKKDANIDQKVDEGTLGEPQEGLIIAHFGATIDVEGVDGDIVRCHVRSNLPALVTGDKVIWHKDKQTDGIISAVHKRSNILSRPDVRGALKPVAANVDRIIIVISPSPRTPVNLIDRYLVATAHDDIYPVIMLNKEDLLDQAPGMRDELKQYEELGYETVVASAKDKNGLKAIQDLVAEGNSVFVGQSWFGKSASSADRRLTEVSRVW